MLGVLKRVKRAVRARLQKFVLRREADKAFRHDRDQFMYGAGALHLDRKAAARAEIVMGYHVLEKGLTMPNRRMGFGKGALIHLMHLVTSFESRFGDDPQVRHAVGVLRAYRELHSDWPDPMPRLDAFLAAHADVPAAHEPHVKREDFYAAKNAPFPEFAASRHVVRHFAGPVPQETIEAAVAIATTAPSACNRQHARVHVVKDRPAMEKILELQGGTRGFGTDADKLLLITSDLSCVRWSWERHDCYVNGGVFAMNLSYALHWHGVAHCLMHWSVSPETDVKAHKLLGIPRNEAIVMCMACGMPPEEFDVASSPRLSASDVLTWH